MKVGRDADGSVQVPPLDAHNLTGWYQYGPAPGQRGPAVILGHVDSKTGISVFYRLRDLHAGDRVYVTLADGKVAAFVVDGLQKVAKDAFPTASVYGKAGLPQPAPDHLRRPVRPGHRSLHGQHHRLRPPGRLNPGSRLASGRLTPRPGGHTTHHQPQQHRAQAGPSMIAKGLQSVVI